MRKAFITLLNILLFVSIIPLSIFAEISNVPIEPLAVYSSTYVTPTSSVVARGSSPVNPSAPIAINVIYHIEVTASYDYNTGKVVGPLRAPRIVVEGTGGLTNTYEVTDVQYTANITNGGYDVRYTNISFIFHGYASQDGIGFWQTYDRTYLPDVVSFTPYEQ